MLATIQRYFIYRPFRAAEILPEQAGLSNGRIIPTRVTTDDRLELRGWRVLPPNLSVGGGASTNRSAAPNGGQNDGASLDVRRLRIVFFPGNAAHRGYRVSELDLLSSLGAEVFLFDYRGYGDNPGRPTEHHIAADARAIWKFVTEEQGIAAEQVVLFGESLGGAVATRLASEVCNSGRTPAGLIVRSTFSTLPDAAAWNFRWFPVRWIMREHYPSVKRIADVSCPLLVVHGARDRIVPLEMGQRLFDAAPPTSVRGPEKKMLILPNAGHNDVHHVAREPYRAAIGEFLEQLRVSSLNMETAV